MKAAYNWNQLYKMGGVAALAVVIIIPVQIVIFVLYPPPEDAAAFLALFHDNWALGLLSLDFLYYLNNGLMVVFYLGLFAAMRNTDFATMLIATVIGLVGIATYYASSVGFEMWAISQHYHVAEAAAVRQQLLAVAQSLLVKYKGTAFDVYYVFNAITLLLVAKVMYKAPAFSRADATWGLISGIFMVIPSTAGTIGLVFSLLSLIPWVVFSVLVGRKLLILGNRTGVEGTGH